jgi:hypothetical protein
MGSLDKIFFIILLFTFLTSGSILVFFYLKSKRNALFYKFTLTNLLLFIWLLCQITETRFTDRMDRQWYLFIVFLPYCFVGVLWLLFSLEYTKNSNGFFRYKYLIFIPPSINYIAGITDKLHHLYYLRTASGQWVRLYGPFFWSNLFTNYFFILLSVILLLKKYSAYKGNVKRQSFLLALATFVPLTANLIHVFRFLPISYELTSLSFAIPFFYICLSQL